MNSWEGQERNGTVFTYANTAAEETRRSITSNTLIAYECHCVTLQNYILV